LNALNPYIPILILMALALVLAAAMCFLSDGLALLLRLKRPSGRKLAPYECGMTPIGGARVRFTIRFYLVAMLFILFDVEAIFLYPWAVVHRWLGLFGLIEILLFILVLGVGYIYCWKRGAFEWD
jgi:NADH-quinone oxidoreductase subunit A